MNTLLSIATEGLYTTQGLLVDDERTITITGSVREITGRPSIRVPVSVTLYGGPVFNSGDLVATRPRVVYTDQNGEISTEPGNQLVILQPGEGERFQVRVRVPDAGLDWVVEVPSTVTASYVGFPSISLLELKEWIVEDRSGR